MSETITVTIRDRSREGTWGSTYRGPVTRKVTISAHCPTCGERRGKPTGRNQYDDGEWYWTNVWENPCGHVDHYANVAKEADKMANA